MHDVRAADHEVLKVRIMTNRVGHVECRPFCCTAESWQKRWSGSKICSRGRVHGDCHGLNQRHSARDSMWVLHYGRLIPSHRVIRQILVIHEQTSDTLLRKSA